MAADIGRTADRHDEAERLAGGERGRPRETVRVGAPTQLPGVGMARDLTRAAIGLTSLMNAGHWRTATMPAHYTRNEAAGKGAVAQFHGYCRRAD